MAGRVCQAGTLPKQSRLDASSSRFGEVTIAGLQEPIFRFSRSFPSISAHSGYSGNSASSPDGRWFMGDPCGIAGLRG